MDAFKQCGQDGQIDVTEGAYTIAKVMDVLDLKNCEISIRGTLTWNDDIQHWLRNSIGVTYASRSTAWRLGGRISPCKDTARRFSSAMARNGTIKTEAIAIKTGDLSP
jgi:hypothetical protein